MKYVEENVEIYKTIVFEYKTDIFTENIKKIVNNYYDETIKYLQSKDMRKFVDTAIKIVEKDFSDWEITSSEDLYEFAYKGYNNSDFFSNYDFAFVDKSLGLIENMEDFKSEEAEFIFIAKINITISKEYEPV